MNFSVFTTYIRAVNTFLFLLVILFYSLYNAASVLSNVWLNKWSSEVPINGTLPTSVRDKYLLVYGGIGLTQGKYLGGGPVVRLQDLQSQGCGFGTADFTMTRISVVD